MENTKPCLITTIDNPYSPFDEFLDWKRFDDLHNYGTAEKIGRLCIVPETYTDGEIVEEINQAVDSFLAIDVLHIYKKAFEGDDFAGTAIPNPYLEKLFDSTNAN